MYFSNPLNSVFGYLYSIGIDPRIVVGLAILAGITFLAYIVKTIGSRKNVDKVGKLDPWYVDFLAVVLTLRGLLNFIEPVIFGTPFDQYYPFLGSEYGIILNVFYIIAGVGVYTRARWGFYSALVVALLSAITEAENTFFEQSAGVLLSLILLNAAWELRGYFVEKWKWDWTVPIVILVILTSVGVYAATRPSESDTQEHYTNLALENMDPSFCDNIKVRNHRESCYVDVNHVIQDPSICDKLEEINMKDACFSGMVKSQKNISYCYKIEGDYSKNFCIRYVGRLATNENI